jgi:hypothetical protein
VDETPLEVMIGPSQSRMTRGIPAAQQHKPRMSRSAQRISGAGGFVRSRPVIQRQARTRLACAFARHGGHWHGPPSAPGASVMAARLGPPGGCGARVTRFGTYYGRPGAGRAGGRPISGSLTGDTRTRDRQAPAS